MSATMEEVLGDESTGGESERIPFGIDLIDHILQDGEGKCNGHGDLEQGGIDQWDMDVCLRDEGRRDKWQTEMQWSSLQLAAGAVCTSTTLCESTSDSALRST